MNESHDMHAHEGHHRHENHHEHETSEKVKMVPLWNFQHEPPQNGKKEVLFIQLNDENGNPIEALEESHEKLMHVIVVSKDLSIFEHVHPEYQGQGKFMVEILFPSGGDYKLIAEFAMAGYGSQMISHWVRVNGEEEPEEVLKADSDFTKAIEGKKITFTFDHLEVGHKVTLTFSIFDANTNEPITDLQPYLGAVGHVVAISANAQDFLHIHPINEKGKGPEAKFSAIFPTSGLYKVWGQFLHADTLITVSYIIEVPQPRLQQELIQGKLH
ncbi:hypothetical protein ACQKK5_01780 [Brevibacillus panacihumi]|uniref:hypothetical protein n=1 Tax=Brevibacillus panacihumi TaxID=497735 RepID=UPI003CFCFAFF